MLRQNLLGMLSIVVAPALVGGKETPTLIDGKSLTQLNELKNIKPLNLVKITKLKNSYIHLKYKVLN